MSGIWGGGCYDTRGSMYCHYCATDSCGIIDSFLRKGEVGRG